MKEACKEHGHENLLTNLFITKHSECITTHRDEKLSVRSFLHGVEELVDGHVDDALLPLGAVHGMRLSCRYIYESHRNEG